MEFLWNWCKKYKKKFLCFAVIFECMAKISGHILHFEGPGKRYLSENPYYQQLSREKKGGNHNALESGVEISKSVFHVLQSHVRA